MMLADNRANAKQTTRLFVTVRRDLIDAAEKLGIPLLHDYDSFDEYFEGAGFVENAGMLVDFCIFSYRPAYKHTFSVAAAESDVAQLVVLRYLQSKLALAKEDFLAIDGTGYVPFDSPIKTFMGEAVLIEPDLLASTQKDARDLLVSAKGIEKYDNVIRNLMRRHYVSSDQDYTQVYQVLKENISRVNDASRHIEALRKVYSVPTETVISKDFLHASNVVTGVISTHAINSVFLIGGASFAIMLLGLDGYIKWSNRSLTESGENKDTDVKNLKDLIG